MSAEVAEIWQGQLFSWEVSAEAGRYAEELKHTEEVHLPGKKCMLSERLHTVTFIRSYYWSNPICVPVWE